MKQAPKQHPDPAGRSHPDMSPLITLTTDFGERDFYVAAMKGVILSRCPQASVVDLGHALPPRDLVAAALFLEGAAPHFPDGTIHVAVVDPGVGTLRHPVAVRAGNQCFVCPDNGLLTLVLKHLPLHEARVIASPACMAVSISPTFHGRDVFAPAAAYLAAGNPFCEIGPVQETLHKLNIPEPAWVSETRLDGAVIHVDAFGNLVTNITAAWLIGKKIRRLRVGLLTLKGIASTFADVPEGEPLAYFGSSGRLEIAVNQGHAANQYGVARNSTVELEA